MLLAQGQRAPPHGASHAPETSRQPWTSPILAGAAEIQAIQTPRQAGGPAEARRSLPGATRRPQRLAHWLSDGRTDRGGCNELPHGSRLAGGRWGAQGKRQRRQRPVCYQLSCGSDLPCAPNQRTTKIAYTGERWALDLIKSSALRSSTSVNQAKSSRGNRA